MRKHFTSLSEAMTDLKARGYINDFNLKGDCIECPAFRLRLTPEHFTIDEYYRFEGMSSVDDNSIVFAIKSGIARMHLRQRKKVWAFIILPFCTQRGRNSQSSMSD
jgi:hypothetical protein